MKYYMLLTIIVLFIAGCSNNQNNQINQDLPSDLPYEKTQEDPELQEQNDTLSIAEELRIKNDAEYNLQIAKNNLASAKDLFDEKKDSMNGEDKQRVEAFIEQASNLIFQAEEQMFQENYQEALNISKDARRAAGNAKRII